MLNRVSAIAWSGLSAKEFDRLRKDRRITPIEQTDGGTDEVAVRVAVAAGQHVRPAGSDIADGTLLLRGRDSLVINTGGEKVYPDEVEGVLKALPDVADVVVIGIPDESWGHAVCAVVEPHVGAQPTLEGLRDGARSHLAGYKLPRRLVLVDHVVRSPAGKPDHRWAAAVAQAELEDSTS